MNLLLAAAAVVAALPSSPADRPWPPAVQHVSPLSPPLSPAEALKTFYLPPGYHLQVVASEPLVRDPIAIDWDTQGRLWVVEMASFLRDLQLPEPNLNPICRIVVLEDTNHDGVMDRRTVFADHLILPRSVKVLEHGVLVAEPPDVWLMHDQNGDLHMHAKERLYGAFGRRNGNVEGNANGFAWGLDNWMHTAESDVDLRFRDGKMEVRRAPIQGEWSVSQDDAGRIFRNSNESPVHVDLVPSHYYSRNPNLVRMRGSYEPLGEFSEINTVWPVRPNPGTNRAYQVGIDRKDGTIARYTSACGPAIYRGDRLPAELYGNLFVAEPAANLVTRSIITDDGSGLRAHKAYPKGDFIASTDERFRPVFISNAPDGTLYIVDMYRGVIQERSDITQYLLGHISRNHLEQPTEMGRIYRVVHDGTVRDETPALAGASPAGWVEAFSSKNGWRRDRAQELLVEAGDKSVAPELRRLLHDSTDSRVQLHALWTLDGLDVVEPADALRALGSASRDVRASALQVCERWLVTGDAAVSAAVIGHLDDPDWWVREQVAATLGALPAGRREAPIATLLERHGSDPVLVDAAISGLRGDEPAVLDAILGSGARSAASEAAVEMLAATIVKSSQDDVIRGLLAKVADPARPEWQRSALLRGAEITLLGATMPGTVVDKHDVLGDRQAEGGAYAFAHNVAREKGYSRGRRSVRLSREPAALIALAGGTGDLGRRAHRVLDRVIWPGKPGVASLPPLSAEEQKRFDAGREVFRNICMACHQPDGRGQDHLAANLIDSPLALAPAPVTVRILLNGKEGPIGLMPPVGAVLSDEQIADVLTYIRREWGQPGTPVAPGIVKEVRAENASRQRAWTNDELYALPQMKGRAGDR